MKIIYEIELDLPDNYPVKHLSSLLRTIKFGLQDRISKERVRFHLKWCSKSHPNEALQKFDGENRRG